MVCIGEKIVSTMKKVWTFVGLIARVTKVKQNWIKLLVQWELADKMENKDQ